MSTEYNIKLPFGQLTLNQGTTEQKEKIKQAVDNADWSSVFKNLDKNNISTESIAKEVLQSDDQEVIDILSEVLKECNEGEDTYNNKYDFTHLSTSEKKYLAKNYGTLENGKYTYSAGDSTYTATMSNNEKVASLRESYTNLQKQDGIVSKITGWVKNLFGAKSSPNYMESKLSALEEKVANGKTVTSSEIKEMEDLVENYSSRSEDGSNTAATATGFGVGVTCGAAIGSALFPGVGTAIGAVLGGFIGGFAAGSYIKVAYEQIDNFTDQTEGNELKLSDMAQDALQGGLMGGVAGAAGSSMKTSGEIGTGTTSVSKLSKINTLLNNIVTFFTPENSNSKTSVSEHKSAKSSILDLAKSMLNNLLSKS